MKLDDKVYQIIFVGYHQIGDYKLYDHVSKKMFIIRDAVIDEMKNGTRKTY